MNLYRSSAKEKFLEEVASYLIDNFQENFDKVKVLLPSGYLCTALQEHLITKFSNTILPNIITFSEISAESEEIFKIPSNSFGIPSKIEERIILTDIINSYNELNFNLVTSTRLAPNLANLFYEIEANFLELEQFAQITNFEQALHWQKIYSFLVYAYQQWQTIIAAKCKVTRAKHKSLMLEAEIERLKNNPDFALVIAGEIGSNKTSWDFITKIAKQKNGHLILPPTPIHNIKNLKAEHALFLLSKLLDHAEFNVSEFKYLGQQKPSSFDGLITESVNSTHLGEIDLSYVEFGNIFDESEFIAHQCHEILTNNPSAEIAIICPNPKNKAIYCKYLEKNKLVFKDLIGSNIFENNAITLLLDIAEFTCNKFNLKSFFKIISHPEIANEFTITLKKIILKQHRFVENFEQIEQILADYDLEQLEFFKKISAILTEVPENKFNSILKHLIRTIEQLKPDIWAKYEKFKIAESIREIYQCEWQKEIDDISEFPKLLKELITGARIFTDKTEARVLVCQASDINLANFDVLFLADCSEGNYPPKTGENPWLNRQVQEKFGLLGQLKRHGVSLYDFYLNLHSPKTYITRSTKQLVAKNLIESSFLLRLKFLLGDSLKSYHGYLSKPEVQQNRLLTTTEYINCSQFPSQISATDIETLIRSPYNFYAKKILNLRAINILEENPSLADFGSFFHSVVEEYTNRYKEISATKHESFLLIAEDIISKMAIPVANKNIWLVKMKALAIEFTEFEELRRKNCQAIFTEIRGELKLDIAGHKLSIIAIADRIEVDKFGNVAILDYKTGAIPTKSDVLSGYSPQLIIEAIILMENGFKNLIGNVSSLCYVKVSSNKPYISTIEITISTRDLQLHKNALISLLEHYITTGLYPISFSDVKYDDYSHLARR